MNVRIQRMIRQTIGRFIGLNYEKASDSKVYLDMLDVLAEWESYRQEHANSYLADVKDIKHTLVETFGSDIRIDEDAGRIYGLSRKPQKQPKVKKTLSAAEIEQLGKDSEMKTRFDKFIHDRSVDNRTAPFPTHLFANFKASELAGGSYSMTCRECGLQEATEWLSRQDFLYFDDKINKWCFHQRAVPIYS